MKKIFIDFDNVIVNSTYVVTKILNKKYNKNVEWEDIRSYDFSDKFPETNKNEILEIFNSDEFFILAKQSIYFNSKKVIEKFSKDFDVFILTIGTPMNIKLKIDFLKENFPFISKYIMILMDNVKMDKSIINMRKEDTIIDDVYSNIESSSAGNRILFSYGGIQTEWNEYGKYMELTNTWREIERRVYGSNTNM